MADQIKKYNRDMPVPTDEKDLETIINTNTGYTGYQLLETGGILPND